ncbi:MAG: amino acid permease [Candidatus Kapabacteria bacterium]|nr:amino acid permease [Candidatus Kapabacteria bacterium]
MNFVELRFPINAYRIFGNDSSAGTHTYMQQQQTTQRGLQPHLGFFITTSIVMGAMIGSGIFKKAAPMVQLLGSAELVIGVWVLAGVITLFGALSNAEIASMIPATGGQYRFFRAMYGDGVAFTYGWAIFSVIQTGSIASIAYVFSDYLATVFPLPVVAQKVVAEWSVHIPLLGTIAPLDNIGIKLCTVAAICVLTFINYRGVRLGGLVSGTFTTLKVLAIAAVIACCFAFGINTTPFTEQPTPTTLQTPAGWLLLLAVASAMSKAFWAYDGWNSITYIAGEVRNAKRVIPKALIIGVSIVIGIYVLVNLAYFYVLPIEVIAQSKVVASTAMSMIFGQVGVVFIAVAVMISTLGTTNGTILSSARAYYAMAEDGLFLKQFANVHPRFHTPTFALIVQCAWSCVLVFSGTFDTLTDMLIFVSWIFYGMSAFGVFILRKKQPTAERPYKVIGYPVVPAVFVVVSGLFCVFTCINDVQQFMADSSKGIPSVTGLLLLLPAFLFYKTLKSEKIG